MQDINNSATEKIRPFFEEMLADYKDNIHSIHITGSAATEYFNEKFSDVNSVIVLKKMDFGFVKFLAPLGKKYGKKGISAPLIMTPEYITDSLDVFPVEFLDFKNIHKTVYGEDIFGNIVIDHSNLRLQCEREVKVTLIGLRQSYIASLGDKKILTEKISGSITGYMPLFRAIIYLLGGEPPADKHAALKKIREITGLETDVFEKMLGIKMKTLSLNSDELSNAFEQYYSETEKLGEIVNGITV
jgi:hypothetical protein